MKKELKIVIVIIVILAVISAIYFEMGVGDKSRYKREVINSFQQGKELKCGEYDVNSKNFILNTGTLTFVAKSEKLEGVIIKVEECSIKEKSK